MTKQCGSKSPRSDAKHFAKCGMTRHYHWIYCTPENCKFKKKKKSEKQGEKLKSEVKND